MVRYSEELIEEIRSSNDIVDVISKYITLKRSGRNFFGLCPFHKEKSPSFAVSPDKQIFHCFGCGAGGNVIHFISKIEGLDFKDTLELLANRVNIELPTLDNLEDDKTARLKSKVYEINKIAAEFYHENLYKPASKTAQEYIKKRKLDNRTLKAFLIGYAGNFNELYLLLKQKGYTEEEMLASSLVKRTENGGYMDSFRKRLMFPIQDVRERVIAFGGRVLDDSKPKYINSPENIVYSKGRNLFGLNVAKKHDTRKIIIVEGYMDAISLYQRGITNVVASLGTAMTEAQGRLLRRYSEQVILGYDADGAGQAAILRGMEILQNLGCDIRVLQIEGAKDPDEYVLKYGPERFQKCVDNAISLVEFKVKVLLKELNIEYTIDTGIVRGLDYYTKTVFEFISKDEGYTVLAGGRYDGLVKELGGADTPAIGFAMGMERLVEIYEKYNANSIEPKNMQIYIANIGKKAGIYATKLTQDLRKKGIYVEKDVSGRSLKAQFKYADKKNAEYCLTIGEEEIASQKAKIKNMKTGEEIEVNLSEEQWKQDIAK